MGKNIIITGGLGYIGTQLCKIYSGVSWNNNIVVIDNRFISASVNQSASIRSINSLTLVALAPGVSVSGIINSAITVIRLFCLGVTILGAHFFPPPPKLIPDSTAEIIDGDSAPPVRAATPFSASLLFMLFPFSF